MKHSVSPIVIGKILVLCLALTSAATNLDITQEKVPYIQATRINPTPPVIDGSLSDEIWKNPKIKIARDFKQLEPDEGKAATESTLVAIVYDDEALYVGFWCYDSEPSKIARQLVRRDREASSDNVTVCIDAFHDHQTSFRFELSAAGVQRDSRIYNDNEADYSWDGVWLSGVKIQPWGWSAELKIPYQCLRFTEKDEHIWGLNLTRNIERKGEYVKWSLTPSAEGGFTSKFGHLIGLNNIRPTGHLELLPYVVSRAETEPKSVGNPDGRDILGNTGFDVKYPLSSNLILDATVNPDFGQVELDEPVLNLTTYETFFTEKRPFFVEGMDLFATDFNLFYSRRIGRAPSDNVEDDSLAYYTDYPDASTILGAAKLTGKLTGGTSIAFLGAVTEKEIADYDAEVNVILDSSWATGQLETNIISADTVGRSGVVAPMTGYSVLRIKQDLFDLSSVGAMLTYMGQQGLHSAVTGGLDWRLVTNNNIWGFEGQAVFSQVEPGITGYGINLDFQKLSGKHVRGSLGGTIKSPDLELNNLGYTSRVDTKHTWGWLQYRTTDDWWIIRNSYNNLNYYFSWNFDGVNYELGGNYNFYLEFINFWALGGGIEIQGEKYSDLETRGNGVWEWPNNPTYGWWFSLDTDYRKKIKFNWNPGGGTDRGGTWWANYVGITYRPRSNMEFELGTNYRRSTNGTRWVENNDNDESIFADLDYDQMSLFASTSIVANKNLSFQLSAEGLISGLDYSNYRQYLGSKNYSDSLNGYDHDYNYAALNSTLIMRWEFSPGSALFLVWTRARSDVDNSLNNLTFSRDFKRLFTGDSQNLFLIKASKWLSI